MREVEANYYSDRAKITSAVKSTASSVAAKQLISFGEKIQYRPNLLLESKKSSQKHNKSTLSGHKK